jgi:lysophospholipase L1-like esterase
MKRILCFGDSNTHGTAPMRDENDVVRFDAEKRWPGVLRAALGSGFDIVEEGHPGRTTVHDDPVEGAHKNGRSHLRALLESHWPLDLVIISLGTNDLKTRHGVSAFDIASSIGTLVDLVRATPMRGRPMPKILVISPPPIIEAGWLADMFAGGQAKSESLGAYVERMCIGRQAAFLDLTPIAKSSPIDGIHFDEATHHAIGQSIYKVALPLLS